MDKSNTWPPLPLGSWQDTYATLHLWTQIVGKVALVSTPTMNHYWNVAFLITARGLTTQLLKTGDRTFTMTFDFVDHRLVIQSASATESIPLRPQTVAEFYQIVMDTLRRMGLEVKIWPVQVEVSNPVRLDKDVTHRSYDAQAANTFWRILVAIKPVFENFRCRFLGKCSPVHFFWGSFDLASTRFSGRRAPERAGADPITRESYSHELISQGFWPGSGPNPRACVLCVRCTRAGGFKDAGVRPSAAFYSKDLSEFILPYEAVRTSQSPETELEAFLVTTYDAGDSMENGTVQISNERIEQ